MMFKTKTQEMMKNFSYRNPLPKRRIVYITLCVAALSTGLTSCKKYLDVVPDNVSTVEHAFKLRNEAEKYLFTCYSFLPKNGDGWYNAGLLSGDELWMPQNDQAQWHAAFRIAQGQQNRDNPYFDEWARARIGGGNMNNNLHLKMWRGIRHCNIFLENLKNPSKVPDISLSERERWIGEVEFLKAYYHYYMLRMYGPIPIIDESKGIDDEDQMQKRMPVDDCVNYISNLLDAAIPKLPPKIMDENTQLGRITQPIVYAVKAKLLVMAASPLFNGNPDYANFKDKDGVLLFNPAYDATKWVKARDAVKEAIDKAEEQGFKLYKYTIDPLNLSTETKTQLSIRNAVTQRWGDEHVWALSNSYMNNEFMGMPPTERGTNTNRGQLRGLWAAPLKIAKMFYTKNGVPIEEDATLNFSNYLEVRRATAAERFNIEPNYETARLNFDREPRFYASLGFDGGIWYMKDGNANGSDLNTFYLNSKNSQKAGYGDFANFNETGYFIKKLVHWESTTRGTSAPVWKQYPWPEIRLADLYLLYAETLNEVEPGSSTAITYLDRIRSRAGLKGVVESWTNFSSNPAKYTSQSGLREIIQRERLIELAFESQRFWDLKRWKLAAEKLNEDITGMNIFGKTTQSYNTERVIFSQKFIAPRDYFWPIGNFDTRRNLKLVENPGW